MITTGTERPPSTRIPGIVVLREMVAQAPDATVVLLEARGYSQGCLLELVAVARPAGLRDVPVIGADFGTGVLLPGQQAAGRAVHRLPDESTGSGGAVGTRIRLWLTPLPPAEGFDLVVDWPAAGVDGQRGRVAGEDVRVAAWDSFPALPAAGA